MPPQHRIAHDYLLAGIDSGLFAEGESLPAVDELARRTGVSPHAVRRAVRVLGDRGVLWSVRKRGTRVLRRPALGRALFMSGWDAHTNLLLQEPISQALVRARLQVQFLPYLFRDGTGFEQLRQLAGKGAEDTVLVTLAQEGVPAEARPAWEQFASRFRHRVGFQFEEDHLLPDSLTVLPDPVVAARLVAEHLLSLGHRRIGVVAGSADAPSSASERHAGALAEMLRLVGAECFAYQYGLHATEGVVAFARRNRCTAWWAITDHQALDHVIRFQQAGLRVPQDISVLGTNDTPWASGGALPLTTLSLNPAAIADAIADAVERAFGRGTESPGGGRLFIPPVLVPRASTVGHTQPAQASQGIRP